LYSIDYGAVWSQITGFTVNTDGKSFLTSVYYTPNEHLSGWHWTKVEAFDNDVLFERIPEFQDIIVPIFCMIFMAAVWQRRRRKH
jgi:hypothetical protein